MPRLTRLRLQDFRNYAQLSLDFDPGAAGRITVITGPNGSGKTNLLEAVSLLMPGRGLRNAPIGELPRRPSTGPPAPRWGINARLAAASGPLEIGIGGAVESDRRAFLLNGAAPANQAEIAAHVAIIWLTPQMDALFLEPASGRRRFLDRLVYALEPAHARQIAAHDTAQTQRSRLLAAGQANAAWLAALEDAIARHAVAASAARLSLVSTLNRSLRDGEMAGFPRAKMTLRCPIAQRLHTDAAVDVEEWLRTQLAASRVADARIGSAAYGAHRADMELADAQTGLRASLASTGQRKALLVATVLTHAALIGAMRGVTPILLLDEPMVHLDADRRALLCAAAGLGGAQFVFTGTDSESFAALRGAARFLQTSNGAVQP